MPRGPLDQPAVEGTVGRRILAFAIDLVFVAVAVGVPVSARSNSSARSVVRTGLLAAVLGFPYHVVLEGQFGQTLGKRVCGLAVVRETGRQCTYSAAAVRTAGRFVDALPIGYLIGLASIGLSDRNQRLGDRLAGTLVVRTDAPKRSDRSTDGSTTESALATDC